MTYRDRRTAKVARLEDWATKREDKAEALHEVGAAFRGDIAFITQPGHDMQRLRDKLNAKDERAYEHSKKASNFRDRAEGINRQLDQSIYSDDHDAIERLEARIAELDAERSRWKAYNASCRKGERNLSLLDSKQQADLESVARYAPYQLRANGAAPSYVTTNLGGNINRQKKRLEELRSK